jgi:predicted ribosome-associated RNA-binding protein Tma20
MKSSMSIHLLKNIMNKLGKKYIFYNGSQLSEDLNQEKYNEKLLNKIQLSLENGDILVLRNMENIYPSLYNLFNQNFTKTKNQSEFHGLRDFYHLIKNTMYYLIEINKINNKEEINIIEKSYEIGIKSLYRNFDGLREPFNSFEEIKKIFDKFYPINNTNIQSPNVFKCLQDNINDSNSRYLLIIMKSSMSIHLLKNIMNKLGKKYIFYNGTQLSEDLNQEKYNEKVLNKIQLSLENGDILVL